MSNLRRTHSAAGAVGHVSSPVGRTVNALPSRAHGSSARLTPPTEPTATLTDEIHKSCLGEASFLPISATSEFRKYPLGYPEKPHFPTPTASRSPREHLEKMTEMTKHETYPHGYSHKTILMMHLYSSL